MRLRLVFCDDLKSERDSFRRKVASRFEERVEPILVSSYSGLERVVDEGKPVDILVTDVNFETVGGNANEGKRIVQRARAAWPDVEVVVFTGHPRDLSAEEVLELSGLGLRRENWVNKLGDDGEEGWNRLSEVIDVLLRTSVERRMARKYRDLNVQDSIRLCAGRGIGPVLDDERFPEFPGLVGKSREMHDVYEKIRRVAPTPAPVLLLGETGCGKELVSRAIHALSGRRGKFVDVNCSELGPELLASELFGHLRGADTRADTDRNGLMAAADGGTFLLDEIGEMQLENQAKLLRALETGEIRPVGSSTTRRVDVRILAATNRDLRSQVEVGAFRRDLLSRIGAYPIVVPPLRDRPEDVPLLATNFLAELRVEYGRRIERIEEAALARLVHRKWSGNVRELRNALIRLLVNLDPDQTVVREGDLPPEEQSAMDPGGNQSDSILARILDGSLRIPLPGIAKTYGKPVALEVVEKTMLHFQGLPDEATCQRYFDMSYRSWQHWAHYNGLTWKKVRGS